MRSYGVEVERPRRPTDIDISENVDELSSPGSYPVKVCVNPVTHTLTHRQRTLQVIVERLDVIEEENKTETIRAKFVVGTDGESSHTTTPGLTPTLSV